MIDAVIKVCFSEDGDLQCRRGERWCHYHLFLSSVAHYSIPHALKGTVLLTYMTLLSCDAARNSCQDGPDCMYAWNT